MSLCFGGAAPRPVGPRPRRVTQRTTHRPRALTYPPTNNITNQRQVKEAEEFAEQDKQEKERVDARNHLESLIFQV